MTSVAVSVFRVQLCLFSNAQVKRSTIFALSTPPGISAIAVIRISGPRAADVFYRLTKVTELPNYRKILLCKLKDPVSMELLDKAIMLWFPSPNSFTGEDVCELHIHGGNAVIKSVLNALHKLPHFRFAEAGEFTKRAFLAGKLDLTEVEGLADLLHAETEAQHKQALKQLGGALHNLYNSWADKIKKCLARLEAYIDFSEDQHLDNTILDTVKCNVDKLKQEIASHLLDKRKGEKLRSGVFAVLVGRPNVGKSSLLNNLCKREIAIVSSTAGTTRDIIETSLNLGGYLVNISDTAGIRETSDSVEQEGVKRTKERSRKADILIFVMESKQVLKLMDSYSLKETDILTYLLRVELGEDFFNDLKNLQNSSDENECSTHIGMNVILLLNKIDLLSPEEFQRISHLENSNPAICAISSTEGMGMGRFVDHFSRNVQEICCGHRGEEPTITQERHRQYVQKCYEHLMEFESLLECDIAIAAYNLRNAANELGKITGKIRVDDILDIIFKDFCIGK
ncbi:tRNA modification GTPase GTPBP3, mitochondrial-like isoform X2 [Stegodyphus dumicola]|nr:tRNA modification GTPase GTPBP3, mitochondrial-like isoform X2 [Stegodyphus dumicola]XP_035210530.1 tRNA modification GTPase GTPBP3, mitochondrial-like isoform X2 [Stegodyphus dumicola]XP_035210531.1 tRNA modification GTPase GTPBP3, mitochondrial-like isoform X2 [Stegodyphus dumicola]XP_035210532.1 tRNA modification GTPase GTPBP3, mitochondrial-like isoform X2 [Stegodyphus dumicola]